jgi:hypothetical protein|tara:strand:+ start:277 stop:669 length:393 start_codon:yes stop_codon:yes gene_type:complete
MADKKLKDELKKILKIRGTNISKERPVKGLLKKEAFIRFIENYKYANDRTLILKLDHRVDMTEFEEPFIQAIEALLKLHFNKAQTQILEWWLYEKWNHEDGVLQLTNTETDEELPSDTPEDLWVLLQTLK